MGFIWFFLWLTYLALKSLFEIKIRAPKSKMGFIFYFDGRNFEYEIERGLSTSYAK